MFPDRVEVRRPGGLPPELTLDDMVGLRAISVPRNEVLAGFLRDIPGYMERVGSGIRFMVTQMREMGLPDPEFSDHLDFMVTFRNGQAVEEQSELNSRQLIGMQIVRERGSISTPEYCVATGATDRMGLRDLQDLVAKGLLVARVVGPNPPQRRRAAAHATASTAPRRHVRHTPPTVNAC